MRIDNYANIPSSGKTDVGDLMSRLNPGDVIRAKVIEITSDEAVLKLFDGTVMRAKMLETMNAKAGETVMLTVSSKSEGTLYLESDRNLSQMIQANPDTLSKLLESLQIKPNALNLQLASELMKAGAPVTTEHLKQSAALLNSSTGLDAEKAVYMVLKGISTEQVSIEMLSKLLEGDLKLGQQLKDIQALLDQTSVVKAAQTTGATINQASGTPAKQPAGTSANQAVGTSANQVAGTTPNRAATDQNAAGNQLINAGDTNNHNQTQTLQAQVRPIAVASQETLILGRPATDSRTSGASDTVAASGTPAASDTAAASGTPAASDTAAASGTPAALEDHVASEKLYATALKTPSATTHASSAIVSKTQQATSGDNGALFKEPLPLVDLPLADRLPRLIESVMDLFVKTDSEHLASELDVNKLKSELYEKLDVLKAAIKSSESLDSRVSEGLFKAAAQIDDTLRLLNQMNSNNILYYQMPVSMAGHDTTAELYVMKRQKNKKKIDPHDTVMFISLDTNHLGRIETLLDVKGSNITVNLRTESKQINDFIKGKIKDLYKGLAACGYKLASIRYALIDSATPPIQQERLLSGIVRENYGKVDYRI